MTTRRTPLYVPPPLLTADDRRPLLTEAQRQHRREIALHEASHLTSCILKRGLYVHGFIRVPGPGKTPTGFSSYRGSAGAMQASGNDPISEAIILASAISVESINPDRTDAIHSARNDVLDLNRQCTGNKLDADVVLFDALRLVQTHWQAIDGVAAGLLALGRADGVVSAKKCEKLARYVRSWVWRTRQPFLPAPTKQDLTDFFDCVGIRLRGNSAAICVGPTEECLIQQVSFPQI